MRRKLTAACVAFVALTLALCGWRAWTNAQEAARAAAQAVEGAQEGAGEKAPAAAPGVELSEEQEALLSAYTSDAEYVAEVLEGNLWESGKGSFAEFARGSVTESAGGSAKAQPFVIVAVEHKAEGDGAGGTIDTWTGSAQTASGEAIFALSQAHTADAGDMPWRLSCSGLALADEYGLVKRAGGVDVSDLSAAQAIIGGEKGAENVASALEEHVAKVAPTATEAAWDGRAEVDFGSGDAVLAFSLDDSSKTTVKVVVSIDDGEVSFQ